MKFGAMTANTVTLDKRRSLVNLGHTAKLSDQPPMIIDEILNGLHVSSMGLIA